MRTKLCGYPTYGAANLQMLGQRQVFQLNALQRGYEVVLTSAQDRRIWPPSIKLRRMQTPPVTGAGWKKLTSPNWCVNQHAQLFIGVDSAPPAVAAAVNTPLISLFGATAHIFWRPQIT
ncbi:glycosyltransferase family 9 protein [Escherichia coli]